MVCSILLVIKTRHTLSLSLCYGHGGTISIHLCQIVDSNIIMQFVFSTLSIKSNRSIHIEDEHRVQIPHFALLFLAWF